MRILIAFKSFKYKAKLTWETVGDGVNEILRNTAIAVPLKYLSNFGRPLVWHWFFYKVELKLLWIKYCVLASNGTEKADRNCNKLF